MLFSTSCTLQFAHHFEKYKTNFPLALGDLLARIFAKAFFSFLAQSICFFLFLTSMKSLCLCGRSLESLFLGLQQDLYLSLSLCFWARNTKSLFGKQSEVFIELFLFIFFMCVCFCVCVHVEFLICIPTMINFKDGLNLNMRWQRQAKKRMILTITLI